MSRRKSSGGGPAWHVALDASGWRGDEDWAVRKGDGCHVQRSAGHFPWEVQAPGSTVWVPLVGGAARNILDAVNLADAQCPVKANK